ncbi:ABC transporter ATP-binding protein [Tistrella bauzanensis]|uniref:ABC transporter ATP-binding protein n=1 Tax=Tistrella TaxID=171436 RepID=UPI0031F67AFF
MTAHPPLLAIRNLSVRVDGGDQAVVQGFDLDLQAGRMMALVGESGSGKTMVARSILGLLPPPMMIGAGSSITYRGQELTGLPTRRLRAVRGAEIGMVFQEPMTSLNPSMTIGEQMAEGLVLHQRLNRADCRRRIITMLDRIGIPAPERCLAAYPHEFSGGMRQRIMLASVMLLKPKLLVADEPTTALDTLVQHDVMELMIELTTENDTAVLLISHDLGMVSHYIEDVVVMRHGEAVERGPARDVLLNPVHDYTRRLVDALPRRRADAPREAPVTTPLVVARDVVVEYPGRATLFGRRAVNRAVKGVSLTIGAGETVALVGGSGSGKTTLGRAIMGLEPIAGGGITLDGRPVGRMQAGRGPIDDDACRQMQIVFQDPYASLDPRMRVEEIVGEPLRLDGLDRAERRERVRATCDEAGLPLDLLDRHPHALSGGQRQRVAIARAIIRDPAFVVADEPVSALDMTVQKQILLLIRRLQERRGFACLFVSHDLGAVEQVADRVVVMQAGLIVEEGACARIFDAPEAEYTRRLLDAAMLLGRSFPGADAGPSANHPQPAATRTPDV